MADVGCSLSWLLSHQQCLRIDTAESIDDDLSLNTLNGIDDNSDATLVNSFKTL